MWLVLVERSVCAGPRCLDELDECRSRSEVLDRVCDVEWSVVRDVRDVRFRSGPGVVVTRWSREGVLLLASVARRVVLPLVARVLRVLITWVAVGCRSLGLERVVRLFTSVARRVVLPLVARVFLVLITWVAVGCRSLGLDRVVRVVVRVVRVVGPLERRTLPEPRRTLPTVVCSSLLRVRGERT